MKIVVIKSTETKNGSICSTISIETEGIIPGIKESRKALYFYNAENPLEDGFTADIKGYKLETREDSLPLLVRE